MLEVIFCFWKVFQMYKNILDILREQSDPFAHGQQVEITEHERINTTGSLYNIFFHVT